MAQKGLKNKDIDLLKLYKEKKENPRKVKLLKLIAFPIAMLVVFLSIFGYVTWTNFHLEKEGNQIRSEVEKLQKEIATDPNIEKYTSLLKAQADVLKYELLYTNINSYPELSQNTFDSILIASGTSVEVTSFSYTRESQIISLQIEALNVNDTELFVRALKDTGTFNTVDYSGYTQVQKSIITESETTEKTDANETEKKSDSSDDKSNATEEALLKLLQQATNSNKEEKTTTSTVYTATVVCSLK